MATDRRIARQLAHLLVEQAETMAKQAEIILNLMPDDRPIAGGFHTSPWEVPTTGEATEAAPPAQHVAQETTAGVYAIPGPPPMETRVKDRHGASWVHRLDGMMERVSDTAEGPDATPEVCTWAELLSVVGPLTVNPLTDHEKELARLYGPPGQRWGNPSQECPHYACMLGWGHIPPHIDAAGEPIGLTEADGTWVNADITPQQAAENPCNCGNPLRHQPGCNRYTKTSGIESGAALQAFEEMELAQDLNVKREGDER